MDLTEAMRRTLFEHTFGTTASDAAAKAAYLRRVGVPEEQIAGFYRPGIHAGMALGGAHPIDVQLVVEQVLGRQQATSVTLRVARDRHAEGHLRIEVVEVGPRADAAATAEGAPVTEKQAKERLQRMLATFTPGSVLHLLAELFEADADAAREAGNALAAERCGAVASTLTVVGLGIDAACPR